MKIEKVKLMNTEEVSNFKKKIYGAGSEKKQLSADYCVKNIDQLIQWHNEYFDIHIKSEYEKYIQKTESYNESLHEKNQIFIDVKNGSNNHKCICGSSLRYVKNFDFVGCSNYNNSGQRHTTINFKEQREINDYFTFKSEYEFPKTYLNLFKKHYKIDFVMSSVLYEFLFNIYKINPYTEFDYNVYNTGIHNQIKSKSEELIVKSICKSRYDNVLEQVHFSMLLDGKFSVRIVDLICAKDDTIYVIEQKKHSGLVDVLKLELYKDIVTAYLISKNDNRKVKAFTVVYEGAESEGDFITLNYFKNEL
jgi:hypothetical protein